MRILIELTSFLETGEMLLNIKQMSRFHDLLENESVKFSSYESC